MKNRLLFSLIIVTFLSCTKTIDFDDEEMAHLVVVNAMIGTGQNFGLSLNQSTSILTNGQNNPTLQGTWDLYEDGILIRQFPSQTGGSPTTDLQPKAGKNYRIVVNADGRQVEAETTIPIQTAVISVDTVSSKTQYNSKYTNYKIKIKDSEGEDYYRLVIVTEMMHMLVPKDKKDTIKYFQYTSPSGFLSEDPVFKSVYNNFGDELIDYGPENEYAIFPDSYFQGKEYTLQFYHHSQIYKNPTNGGDYGNPGNPQPAWQQLVIYDRVTIHMQRLSKDMYNYLKYLKMYNHYHDNPFSEPVAVFSNIKNGAGIFAGFNDETKFQYENTYIPYSMDTIKVEKDGYSYGY